MSTLSQLIFRGVFGLIIKRARAQHKPNPTDAATTTTDNPVPNNRKEVKIL